MPLLLYVDSICLSCYRMTPYACLASGQSVGLIEAVPDSATIMKIQEKSGAKAALQLGSKALHTWIKQQNTDR